MPGPKVGTAVSAHSGTRKTLDDSKEFIFEKAYHISHCKVHVMLIDPL